MSTAKRASGRRAADLVRTGSTLGLGTGSTVFFTLERLAERIREEGLRVRGVPTSVATENQARELGIPLVGLDEVESLELTIDGADEVDPGFHLTKGGGGALLREKVVASITKREVIVLGRDKLVERLGATFPLPVEVTPFAVPVIERRLERELGCEPVLRLAAGVPFVTDNQNHVLDCRFPEGIADPPEVERRLAALPGVVESGLFCGLAHVLVIADDSGDVEVRTAPGVELV